jgi:hypothetical protein
MTKAAQLATVGGFAQGPAFSAYLGTSQALSSSVWTKLTINTEEFDTNNNFDSTTNYRFTPTVAGYYHFDCAVAALASQNSAVEAALYKNGSSFKIAYNYGTNVNMLDDWGVNFSALIYMNGTTDYVELYGLVVGSGLTINSGQGTTWISAHLARAA